MKTRSKVIFIFGLSIIAIGIIGICVFNWLFADLPDPSSINTLLNQPSIRITDRNNQVLYEILPEIGGRQLNVPLESIPPALRQATIATEDARFYQNPGIDLGGILRALWLNLRGRETPAGGSTITQQVARNLLLSENERYQQSVVRKLRESYLAWQITRRLSKDEILGLYLNYMYYGGLAYGAEAAAQTFFGKPVSTLDLAECALLAGLPQAPALYNPFTDPEAAKTRQEIVLGLMEKHGYLSSDQRDLAVREPLIYSSTPYPLEAPHFVMMVRQQLDQLFTPQEIARQGGLVVRTTLDLDWQHLAQRAIDRHLADLQNSPDGLGHNVNSAALVAIDPLSGEILAMVGSPDFEDSSIAGFINMTLSPRQPGSALKPVVYAAALDPSGAQAWTAATSILDVKTAFTTHDRDIYIPENYDRTEHGPVSVRTALASSLNIPAVITLNHIGIRTLFSLSSNLGITTLNDPEHYDLSVAVGGGEVRLLDLTAAYGAFANGGYRVFPGAILDIRDGSGKVIYQPSIAPRVQVLDERVAWLISDILSDNEARRLGFGPNSVLRLDRPAAVKTGTTTNFHDNWTIGYTPDLVVGVWVGNTNYEPMRDVTGLTGAAPIWHDFMRSVLTGKPEQTFTRPAGLTQAEICVLSGLLPTPACPYRRIEWFIDGTQPTSPDHFYTIIQVDSVTGQLADENTPPEQVKNLTVLDLPPLAQPWAHANGYPLLGDYLANSGLAWRSDDTQGDSSSGGILRLLSPSEGAAYRISNSTLPEAQRLMLEAAGESGLSQVSLWIDGDLLASFNNPPYRAWWTLSEGQHQAWVEGIDANGEQVASQPVTFTVQK
jgi:penicillin-binding protein 1C